MNVAIIPAAGHGLRVGGPTPKQFLDIAGAPIIIHTLRCFDACPDIQALAVALPADRLAGFTDEARRQGIRKPLRVVVGGSERRESIRHALDEIADLEPEIVAVHDAVRPFIRSEQISAVVQRAAEIGAAILALRVTETIKEVEDGLIQRTIDRRHIYRAQTPQAFRYDLLRRANDEARRSNLAPAFFTDDAMLVEHLGVPVAIVEGSASNIKITTPEDLTLAEMLFARE
jgi:2-C-methyl-D-erythritol 4-phosphate cytidylyltransferase